MVSLGVTNVHREFACDDAVRSQSAPTFRERNAGRGSSGLRSKLRQIEPEARSHRRRTFRPVRHSPAASIGASSTRSALLSSGLSKSAAVLLAGLAVLTLPYVRAQNENAKRLAKQETAAPVKAPESKALRRQGRD